MLLLSTTTLLIVTIIMTGEVIEHGNIAAIT